MSDMREMLADMTADAPTDPLADALDEVRACDDAAFTVVCRNLESDAGEYDWHAVNGRPERRHLNGGIARALRAVAALVIAARETKS